MKKIKYIIFFALFSLSLTGCIKDDGDVVFDKSVIEFDAATYNAKATGKNYPLLTRVPGYGLPVLTANPAITRASGIIKFRVNLVGKQRLEASSIDYTVVAAESTAIAGTHFNTSGKITIPANSSFGEVEVQVINPGVASATPVILVLEVKATGDLNPNENYKRIGLSISQN